MDDMTLIKLYELHYIDRAFFLEQIICCGLRTVAEEEIERFFCYIERAAERIHYDYFVIPYQQ